MDSGMFEVSSFSSPSPRFNENTPRFDYLTSNLGFSNPSNPNLFCEYCGATDHVSAGCHILFGNENEASSNFHNHIVMTQQPSQLQNLTDILEKALDIMSKQVNQLSDLKGEVDSLKIQVGTLATQNKLLEDKISQLVSLEVPIEP